MQRLKLLNLLNIVKKHKHELGKYNGSYSLYRKCRVLFHMENVIVKCGEKLDTCMNYNYIKYQMRKIYIKKYRHLKGSVVSI